jgi:hypothetical protein
MRVLRRSLPCVPVSAGVTVLDAIEGADGTIRVFLSCGAQVQDLVLAGPVSAPEAFTGAGGPILTTTRQGAGPIRLGPVGAAGVELYPTPEETGLLVGRRCLVGQVNGQDATCLQDWLAFHAQIHRADGAVVLVREGPAHADNLSRALKPVEAMATVILLDAPIPLGEADAASERAIVNAPDAPGRRHMVASPDPWTAPLGGIAMAELMRRRFLDRAEGVASVDACDLIMPDPEGSVFDRAHATVAGVVALVGERAYPWALAPGAAPRLADHVCVAADARIGHSRWCISPAVAGSATIWRASQILRTRGRVGHSMAFRRCMALRHDADQPLVARKRLVEDPVMVALSEGVLARAPMGAAPRRMPALPSPARKDPPAPARDARTLIVTTMKDEGPFILEWIAHHRAIGVDDFLIYTNDCSDGTDRMLDLLAARGILARRDNPYRETDLKPQHAALRAAETDPRVQAAGWVICMDVDEFINVHAGEGRLSDLHAALGEVDLVSLTWRLFGNGDIAAFEDVPVTRRFTLCAAKDTRNPLQAWGIKTLFRNDGTFPRFGVHRPRGAEALAYRGLRWVNGSGRPVPPSMYRNAWRSTPESVGYDLVTLNHYAVRSAESFLVKRDRGRVNHVDRDQGLPYWFRMNHNVEEDLSIQPRLGMMEAERARLMADPEIAAAHHAAVAHHRARIADLRGRADWATFFAEITGSRMRRLARLHRHFDRSVYDAGPQSVPDEVLRRRRLPPSFRLAVRVDGVVH